MKKTSFTRAFTLVELMVVIVIIALLTGIIVTNLVSSRGKGRDVKRVSDLGQIQLALELYFDRCKQYPQPGAGNVPPPVTSSCTIGGNTIFFSNYISTIPTPPTAVNYDYYVSGTPPVDYVLHTTLETTNDILKDGLQGIPAGYSVQCYDASHLLDYCLGPK